MPAMRLSDRVAQQLLELIQTTQRSRAAPSCPRSGRCRSNWRVAHRAAREAIQKLASRGVLESRLAQAPFCASVQGMARPGRGPDSL